MYESGQSIREPFGITVFGSALVRVPPDLVSLILDVARTAKHPKEAFEAARKGARAVAAYLKDSRVNDVRSSRVTLEQEYVYTGGERRFVGYVARIGFNVVLHDLDRMEEILAGVVDAGVNAVNSVSFQTAKLKEVRTEAREKAVLAAVEKARVYARSAGVALGAVLHIEDVNPDVLTGRQEGHVTTKVEPDEAGSGPIDPGAITIGGAVKMAFAIVGDAPKAPPGG